MVNVIHKLVKMNTLLPRCAARIVKQIHQCRLAAANTAVQIQAFR